MSNYYDQQRGANKEIDSLFEEVDKGKRPLINIKLLKLDITNSYAVSMKSIDERIKLLLDAYEGRLTHDKATEQIEKVEK